jgi:hypothetical protein
LILALNSCHGNNVATVHPHFFVKYHGSHNLSTLAYVLSVYDELYVVHLHPTKLVASVNIYEEFVTLFVLNLLHTYIVFNLFA